MNPISEHRASWVVTALAVWYVTWTGYSLSTRVPAFRHLFAGLGAELPWLTQLVLTTCIPAVVWPITIAAVVLLIVKEVKVERVIMKTLISTIVFMCAASFAAVVTQALHEPMIALVGQIGY